MEEPIAYVNGDYVPLGQARVPVLDRGFLLADGAYEVLPAYAGRPFRLTQHLARLERSLSELRIANPHARAEWTALIEQLTGRNGSGDLMIYLQVTRGAPASRAHVFPQDTPPTVVGWAQPLPLPSAEALANGVGVFTTPDIRWGRCDIKSIALLPNLLATQSAKERNCNEAVYVRGKRVTEGASSNVFAVIEGEIVTPPNGPEILPGVTRDLVLELLKTDGITCAERDLTLKALRSAEEIWLTSSTREVLPVSRLDDKPVSTGKPGPLWKRVYGLFQDYKHGVTSAV